MIGKGKGNQGIGLPVARQDLPDGGLVGVEVPLARGADPLPVHADLAAIAVVFSDRADRLDRHHRDGVAPVVERQVALADVRGLDGDAFAHAHGAHLSGDAVIVEAVLPEAIAQEALGLVAAFHHGADEPAGGGGLGGAERWRDGVHSLITPGVPVSYRLD